MDDDPDLVIGLLRRHLLPALVVELIVGVILVVLVSVGHFSHRAHGLILGIGLFGTLVILFIWMVVGMNRTVAASRAQRIDLD